MKTRAFLNILFQSKFKIYTKKTPFNYIPFCSKHCFILAVSSLNKETKAQFIKIYDWSFYLCSEFKNAEREDYEYS